MPPRCPQGALVRGRRRPADDATDREVQTSGPASVRDMAPPTSAFLYTRFLFVEEAGGP